jgi:transglutaminase-like putative cysteine protease
MKIIQILLGFALLAALPATGDSFPPAGAPAVVLSRKAELLMAGYGTDLRSTSRLKVAARVKILTEAGRPYAEVLIPHNRRVHLENLRGSVVLPSGRTVPLPPTAVGRREVSKRRGRYVTSVVFPEAVAGAVLDYSYELVYRDLILLDPWSLSERLPVLRSEIVFKVPPEIEARWWLRDPLGVGVHNETVQGRHGSETRVWADRLPAVDSADRATLAMMLPTFYRDGVDSQRLMSNWATSATLFHKAYYKAAGKSDGGVAKQARALTSGIAGERERIEAVYRFVRDQVATQDSDDVFLPDRSSVRGVLAAKRGEAPEKALLLQSMLRAAGVPARLVWAADRANGPVDVQLANPGWFDTVLVAVDLDGRRLYLDPSAPSLEPGQLRPGYEGTTAVVLSLDPEKDPKATETVILPGRQAEENDAEALVLARR